MVAAIQPLDEISFIHPDAFLQGPPHEIWKRLRRERPVFWHQPVGPIPGHWAITKYDDIIEISRQPTLFISSKGITAGTNPDDPTSGVGKMLIVTDPPRHVRLRRLVNRSFTPRAVAQLEPRVRRITRDLIARVAPKGSCDFVVEVSANLPLAVICELMGVPESDWPYMFALTNRSLGADDPEYRTADSSQETFAQAQREMFQYFAELGRKRAANPHEDLLTTLLNAEVDGDKLTEEEILFFCFLLIVAGNETTRNAISGGLLALIEHPEEKQKLLVHPELLPSAVEEILRWTSPVMHMARVATQDYVLRGQTIRAGDRVVMWYPSANRDEDVFPDGDRFRIDRQPNDHLAFGIGEHFCLGAALARQELRVMFDELLRALPDIELDGPVERLRSNFIGGIKHMPVRFTPRG